MDKGVQWGAVERTAEQMDRCGSRRCRGPEDVRRPAAVCNEEAFSPGWVTECWEAGWAYPPL